MQRQSSILGPNIVDFGTHFDISSWPGPNMQHTLIIKLVFDRQTTDFLLKNGPPPPPIDPKSRKMGVYFQHLFDAALEPCFHDFISKIDSKLAPKWEPKVTQEKQ